MAGCGDIRSDRRVSDPIEQDRLDDAAAACRAALGDLADAAALLSHCDLVVTVDTAAAHIAGALGLPTWLLLPYSPDYRWLLERSDSPWYPTMKLYRQPRPGAWEAAIDAMRRDLTRL